MHWPTSRKSKLSIENKLKIYKKIIKPIWTWNTTVGDSSNEPYTQNRNNAS